MNDRKSPKTVRKNITATVKFFDEAKGFGFVSPEDGSPDAFVHISVLANTNYTELVEGMKIACDLSEGDRGPQVAAIHEPEDGEVPSPVGQAVEAEGVVVAFVPEHRYAFVAPDGGGKQIFVHIKVLERAEIDMEKFGVDARVKCVIRSGLKGPIADSLELLEG
jgi:cold shock protein